MINWQNLPDTSTPLNKTNLDATNAEIAKRYNLAPGETNIASATDLNNLTAAGTYRSETATISASLSNCPVTNMAFKMVVENLANANRYRQTIYCNDAYSTTYVRTYHPSGWGYWVKLQTNKVETGTLTYNTTYVVGTPDVNSYARNGNVVQIGFRAKLSNSIPNNTILITLPWKSTIASGVMVNKGTQYSPTAPHFAYTSTNSNFIKISTWAETDKYIHIAFTYITDEE